MNKPKEIPMKEAAQIISSFQPSGCFFLKDGKWYVGIDNRTGKAWTKGFLIKEECLSWLMLRE